MRSGTFGNKILWLAIFVIAIVIASGAISWIFRPAELKLVYFTNWPTDNSEWKTCVSELSRAFDFHVDGENAKIISIQERKENFSVNSVSPSENSREFVIELQISDQPRPVVFAEFIRINEKLYWVDVTKGK